MLRVLKRGNRLTRRDASLAFQSAVLTGARGVGFVITAAIPIVLVRVFDLEGFGIYKITFLVAATTVSLLNLGFNASIFYFVPRAEGDGHNYLVQAVLSLTLLGMIGAGALMLSRGLLAQQFSAPELMDLIPIVALYVLITIPSASVVSVPVVDQRPVLAAWIMAGSDFFRAAALIGAGVVFRTVAALAWAAVVISMIQGAVLLAYLAARRESRPRPIRWAEWKSQIQYAIPFGVAVIFAQGLERGHAFFVSGSASPGDFAIYAVGIFQIPIIAMLVNSVAEVVIVQAAPAYKRHDMGELRRLWRNALRPLAVLLIPVWAMCEVVAPELIGVLFGSQYLSSVPIFRIFLFAIVVHIIIDHGILRATGDTRFLVWANAAGFLASVAALFLLTPFDLMRGSVWAYVIGVAVIRLLGLAKVASRLEMRLSESIPWRAVVQALLASGGSAACAYLAMQATEVAWMKLIIGCLVFTLLYGAMVWTFQLLPRGQIRDLRARLLGQAMPG